MPWNAAQGLLALALNLLRLPAVNTRSTPVIVQVVIEH